MCAKISKESRGSESADSAAVKWPSFLLASSKLLGDQQEVPARPATRTDSRQSAHLRTKAVTGEPRHLLRGRREGPEDLSRPDFPRRAAGSAMRAKNNPTSES